MHVNLTRGLIRMGEFVQSLAVVVMDADDLVEFSRQGYGRPQNVATWGNDALVDSGLTVDERELLAAASEAKGDLLLLCVGGGREAIPLARMGFRVTGVDYVAAMVDSARENARSRGVSIEGMVQDVSRLDVRECAYDVVWLSSAMYSSVPTRKRRVEMVRRIARAMKPGGLFLCEFHWRSGQRPSRRAEFVRRVLAATTLGNLGYEAGDMLRANIEFAHEFGSEDAIRSELEEGGLSVVRIQTGKATRRGGAVCRKGLVTGQNAS